MSLEATLARIAQIETALSPSASVTQSSAAAATGGVAAPAAAASSDTGASTPSFATALAQAMAPASTTGATAAGTTDTALTTPLATTATYPTTSDAALTTPLATTATYPTTGDATDTTLATPLAATATYPTTATATDTTLPTLPASAYTPLSGSALTTALQTTPTAASQPLIDAGQGNQAMVAIARSQIGQAEEPPGSNESPAITMYRSATQGAIPGDPWCAYFASWVAQQAGTPVGDQGQGYGAVSEIWNWAQQNGRAIVNGPGVVPQPGDLICFGDAHVGVVEGVLPNGDIETIEGNYDNRVSQNIRSPTQATGYVEMS